MQALTASVQSPAAYAAALRNYRYKRTPAEILAGLTAADIVKGFDPGDIRRYGGDADADGATNYAAMVAALASGPRLIIPCDDPSWVFDFDTTLEVSGDKSIVGGFGGSQAALLSKVNYTGAGIPFEFLSAEYGAVYMGYLEIRGGDGSWAISSSRPQSLFEFIHMESYVGSGIQLLDTGTGSWSTAMRNCKWVGPASQTAYRGYEIDVNGGQVLGENLVAIRGDIGIHVIRCEALLLLRPSTNIQISDYSSSTAADGQCGIRLSGADAKRAVRIMSGYIEGSTTQIYVESAECLSIVDCFMDDLGNGGTADIYLKDSNVKNATIRGNYIRTRTNLKAAIENNGLYTRVDDNSIDAQAGPWLKTTTKVLYSRNQIVDGTLDDASGYAHDMEPQSGTWTPTFAGSGTAGVNTYGTQYGRWWKIGRRVFYEFLVAMTAKGTAGSAMAGNVAIEGLPFAVPSYASAAGGLAIASYDNINLDGAGGRTALTGVIKTNSTQILLLQVGDNVASSALTVGELNDTSGLRGSGSYDI